MTMQHAVVGIDVAKDTHAAKAVDFRGRELTTRHLAFSNTSEGFERLLQWMGEVQAKHRLSSLIIGLEPTGHYWFNLAHWLLEQEITVVLVNPVTTHRNKENRDNSPAKNDPKDALVIAELVSRGYYTDYSPHAFPYERLKTTMSHREYWAKLAVSLGNRIVRWIDLYFPEFRSVFREWSGLRALATLRALPLPSDLRGLQAAEIVEQWRKQGMKRAGGASGLAKAAQLVAAATRSMGDSRVPEEARRDIQRLLSVYDELTDQLDAMQREVEEILKELPIAKQLQSIQGLGTITLAALLGCAGDLSHYTHGRQLLRRAGLNLTQCTSGKYTGQIKLAKRGDSLLRKYLFLGMLGLVRQHPDFKRWHAQNQKKGMQKMASLFKLIGKLGRVIIGMIQRGEPYRAETARAA